MEENEKYLLIFNHFSLENQLEKLKEECDELIEAIKEYDGSESSREHIVEETGDVQNVLNQFKLVFKISDKELIPTMIFKNDRTLERIESGYYKRG